MARFFIPLSAALPAALLWCVLVALALRLFGVRLWLGLPGRGEVWAIRRLSALQYGMLGAAMWGVGMAVAVTVNDYVCWKLWPAEYPALRARDLGFRFLFCILVGFALALLLRRRYSRPSSG